MVEGCCFGGCTIWGGLLKISNHLMTCDYKWKVLSEPPLCYAVIRPFANR